MLVSSKRYPSRCSTFKSSGFPSLFMSALTLTEIFRYSPSLFGSEGIYPIAYRWRVKAEIDWNIPSNCEENRGKNAVPPVYLAIYLSAASPCCRLSLPSAAMRSW